MTTAASCDCQSQRPAVSRAQALQATEGYVLLRAGTFLMGSAEDEISRYTNEAQHEVTLTHDFELARTEVTQEQYQALMGYNPARFANCPSCPVETVSWHEAAAACNALSARHQLAACYSCQGQGPQVTCEPAAAYARGKIYSCPGYRLPTDAEWEYAYRAGTTTPYYNGTNDPALRVSCSRVDPISDTIAWYCANAEGKTHPVGQKQKNPWGVYDLAGNVWEWCHDTYLAMLGDKPVTDPWGIPEGSMRVVRGGSWKYYSRGLRAANRAWYKAFYRGNQHGFRPARSRSFPGS